MHSELLCCNEILLLKAGEIQNALSMFELSSYKMQSEVLWKELNGGLLQ